MAYTKQTKEIKDRLIARFGSKQGVISKIKDMFNVINRRINTLKDDETAESFIETQKQKFRTITKTKSVDKLATGNLSGMSYKQLDNLVQNAEYFLYSKRSTPEGRSEIRRKQIESLKQGGYDLTDQQFDTFVMMMNNDSLKSLLEQNVLSSDQVLQIVESGNRQQGILKALDIIGTELNDYNSKTNMYKSSGQDMKKLINTLIDNDNYRETDIFKQMKGL